MGAASQDLDVVWRLTLIFFWVADSSGRTAGSSSATLLGTDLCRNTRNEGLPPASKMTSGFSRLLNEQAVRFCENKLTSLSPQITPVPELLLHVIVRPNAWTAPITSPPPAAAAPTLTSEAPALPPTPTVQVSSPPISPSVAVLAGTDEVLDAAPLPSPGLAPPAPPEIQQTPPTPAPSPPPPSVLPLPEAHAQDGYRAAYVAANYAPSPPPTTSSASPSTATANAATATTGGAGQYIHFLSYLQRLIPLQRALLLLNLQKAHAHYQSLVAETASKGERKLDELTEVNVLLEGLGLIAMVQEAEKQAEKEYEEMLVERFMAFGTKEDSMKVVQIKSVFLHPSLSLSMC